MRKVYEDQDMITVGCYQSLLDDRGVETLVKNEYAQMAMGEVPFTQVYPELWVLDDTQYQEAVELIQEARGSRELEKGSEVEVYSRSEVSRMALKMGLAGIGIFLLILVYHHYTSSI